MASFLSAMTQSGIDLLRISLAIVSMAAFSSAAQHSRPNLLFILTEDQSAQMGFVGTPGLQGDIGKRQL
jgi:hypothetical protein